MAGRLYLIPTTLGDDNPFKVLPSDIKAVIGSIKNYLVEDERTARRFLKKVDKDIVIDELKFNEINKRTRHDDMVEFLSVTQAGEDVE